MEDISVPLIVFGSITLCIWATFHYKNREKEKIQDTICKAIDAGQQLNPETISALGVRAVSTPLSDRRKSVLMTSIGVAVLIFAQVIPDDEAPIILSGIAAFPIMLGVAYFIVYRLVLNETR